MHDLNKCKTWPRRSALHWHYVKTHQSPVISFTLKLIYQKQIQGLKKFPHTLVSAHDQRFPTSQNNNHTEALLLLASHRKHLQEKSLRQCMSMINLWCLKTICTSTARISAIFQTKTGNMHAPQLVDNKM